MWYGEAKTETQALELIDTALAAGQNLIDTADCYGSAERMVGNWLAKNPSRRSELVLSTKFGACNFAKTLVDDFIPESDPTYVKMALYRSLYFLNTDYIDIYYQRTPISSSSSNASLIVRSPDRVDPDVPIEVVMEALRAPLASGTIRWLGLSECSAATLRRAKAVPGIGERIVAVQVEFSPFSLDIERDGLAEAAAELGVSVVCYAPLGRG